MNNDFPWEQDKLLGMVHIVDDLVVGDNDCGSVHEDFPQFFHFLSPGLFPSFHFRDTPAVFPLALSPGRSVLDPGT